MSIERFLQGKTPRNERFHSVGTLRKYIFTKSEYKIEICPILLEHFLHVKKKMKLIDWIKSIEKLKIHPESEITRIGYFEE